jgi:formate-dependent nitrite reductase cytochrome c552 subunit
MGIGCANCHDPHKETGNPAQLRNPVASMADYSLSTSDVFTNKYDPSINVCAQCHNHRGASWTSSSRPPHHSPQYNMLIGTVGELASGEKPNEPATHAYLEKQCVSCHMQTKPFVSEEEPAITGHRFKVGFYDACLGCHSDPGGLVEFVTQEAIPAQIDEVKRALDMWATTKAPEALRSKYGPLAWEYTNPGSLSTGTGPSSSEQALIPDNIKKARFDLYLVVNDGSYGVHNGPYSVKLLDTALAFVQQELNK